jgi:glycosyltransferase involved in cell wall biosynthesis
MGMKLLWDYKKMNVPYVLDCHMLEMASENRFREFFRLFYRKFVTPVILKNNIPLIRVVDTDFVQKHYNIPLSKTKLLSFGTDTDFYKPDPKIKEEFRKELGIDSTDFVVIYAGKMDPAKGGEFLAESLKEKINIEGRNLKFVIIGNPPKDEYGAKVEKLLSQSENNIIRFPTQTYFDLAKFYQIADIAVFPKQCSMSYFEVQSCELPVVLEENEVNNLRVSNKKGLLFPRHQYLNLDHQSKNLEICKKKNLKFINKMQEKTL